MSGIFRPRCSIPLHGGSFSQREQSLRPPRFGGLDLHLSRARGPRVHGRHVGPQGLEDGRERRIHHRRRDASGSDQLRRGEAGIDSQPVGEFEICTSAETSFPRDFHGLKTTKPLQAVWDYVRREIPAYDKDRFFNPEMERAAEMLRNGDILRVCERFLD